MLAFGTRQQEFAMAQAQAYIGGYDVEKQDGRRDDANVAAAVSLVNPASGIANDYLNLFNEIVMLVEQLPSMPDLFEDVKNWRPVSYRDYFAASSLPGSQSALEAYDRLDSFFRKEFEGVVGELDMQATGVVAAIRLHLRARKDSDPDGLSNICERGGAAMRSTLERAVTIVNDGIKGLERKALEREARLQAVRARAVADVEDFYARPIWRGRGDRA